MPTFRQTARAAAVAATLLAPATTLAQNEIPVTYQGRLTDSGAPANGLYDIRFLYFDAEIGGTQVLPLQEFVAVEVTDGLFQVELDYPRDGQVDTPRWIQILARQNGEPFYDGLQPRQRLTPAPEAGNTYAARLQPDGRVLIGTGGPNGQGAGYDEFDPPVGFTFRGETLTQTFIAQATGTPTRVSGKFNEASVGAVDVLVEIYNPGGPLLASGEILNQAAPFQTVFFDTFNGLLLCGAPYELVVSYTDSVLGVPETKATTGIVQDPYPDGEIVGLPTADLNALLLVDRGESQVTVFDDGLALLNGGLIVGPDDSGDLGVVLPKASVGPGEMLGEPGLIESVPSIVPDPANAIRTARVMPPTDGYVLAIGTGHASLNEARTVTVMLTSSIPVSPTYSQSASSAVNTFNSFSLGIPVTVQGVFPVTAGQQVDIYLSGPSFGFSNAQLNAMFFPTEYSAPNPAP